VKKLTVIAGDRTRLEKTAREHLWEYILKGSANDRDSLFVLDNHLTPRPPRLLLSSGPRDPPK